METPNSEISTGRFMIGSSSTSIISLHGQSISTKLDDANYLLWKQQIVATIEGFGLEKFLFQSGSVPDQYIPANFGNDPVLNPAFVDWRRQDQLITSWLLSSMTEGVLVSVVGLTNSKDIWDTVEANFASQSRAKLMQLKLQLQTLKKCGMTMKDYLNKVKACCDMLASAGEKVTEDNHILHILTGLGSEYNPVMVSLTLTSRAEVCTLREVKALLLSYESRLEMVDHSNANFEGSTPTANYASSNLNGRSSNFQNSNRGRGYSGGDRGGRGNRSRGGRFNGNYKPRCQICKILGHTTDRCYERHNQNFVPDSSSRSNNAPQGQRSSGSPYS